jgi:hypothetical protein
VAGSPALSSDRLAFPGVHLIEARLLNALGIPDAVRVARRQAAVIFNASVSRLSLK